MLSNAYFLAKFRFDTSENEPAKNCKMFCKKRSLRSEPLLKILGEQRVSAKVHLRAAFAIYRLAQHPANGVPLVDAHADTVLTDAVVTGSGNLGHFLSLV